MIEEIPFDYVWKVNYKDGTNLKQVEYIKGELVIHKFAEIKQSEIQEFQVYKKDTGTLVLAFRVPEHADLICFVRHYHSFVIGRDGEDIQKHYAFGYKELVKGVSVEYLVFIKPDGTIILQ